MKKHSAIQFIILMASLATIAGISCAPRPTLRTGPILRNQRLVEAIIQGNVQEVQQLISGGDADVSAWVYHQRRRKTPLHIAVQKNNPEIAKMLISAGANLNAKYINKSNSYENASPPIFSAGKEMLKLLIDSGADVNSRSADASEFTPLHFAVKGTTYREADIEIVKMLISAGADVNAASRYGETPLESASKRIQVSQYAWVEPRQDIISLLKQHGAKTRAPRIIDQIRKK